MGVPESMKFSEQNNLSIDLKTFQSYLTFLERLCECICEHVSELGAARVLSENLKFIKSKLEHIGLWNVIVLEQSVIRAWRSISDAERKSNDLTNFECVLNAKIQLVERKIQEINDVIMARKIDISQQMNIASKKKEAMKLKKVVDFLQGVEGYLSDLVIQCRLLFFQQRSMLFVEQVIATASENIVTKLANRITLGFEKKQEETKLITSSQPVIRSY